MTTDSNGKHGPLHGIRVIDWTMWQFGPVSTMMLADLGAEVIKIESLDGDHGRQFTRVSGAASGLPEGLNAYFESLNRQKLSMSLDLKKPKAIEIMYRLVKKSDVFVQNFRKGVAERLGLGYEDLKEHNPKIVYGAATGYGPEGPDSEKPAFALTGEARSGSLWWAGPNDDVPYNLQGIADQISGIMLSYGILGGLMARERFGIGQKVDVSHLGSMMWLGGNRNGMGLLTGNRPQRQDRRTARNPLWNTYKCKGGKWIAFSMDQGDRYWPDFCRGLDRLDLIEDERFSDMNVRADNKDDAWTVFFDEREQLLDFWDGLERPVFVLTGDLHNSFAIKITDRVWEFASGPHSSSNHSADHEGGRPANGPFQHGPRPCEIRWSSYVLSDLGRGARLPHYCVVQINNVFRNPAPGGEGEDRWIAFPRPHVVFQYYDGLTGDLAYAESIFASAEK